jgi:hypothetical protein
MSAVIHDAPDKPLKAATPSKQTIDGQVTKLNQIAQIAWIQRRSRITQLGSDQHRYYQQTFDLNVELIVAG